LYFSGFCLNYEESLFDDYLEKNDFVVSGFSYGAILAFEYVLDSIKKQKRVDKLQLFSPAYFVNETQKFKRMQLMFFQKDKLKYIDNFIKNTIYPVNLNINKYTTQGTYKELDTLLNYKWDKKDLQKLLEANIKLEVFIGAKDKIVNANISKDFFRNFGEVYFIKDKGHIL
jgi:hypothetical protein